jgi:probable F420-dependent oxidoreductase
VRVGLSLPQLGGAVSRHVVQGFCERSEELGFTGLWVQQHLFFPHQPTSGYAARPGLAIPERYRSIISPLETLAAAAAWTSVATIGTSVLVAGYHRPVDLAQRLSTLDLLSEGRLIVGFSVGWSDDEHRQMDVDPRTRGARCDELIDALEACWGPDPVSFSGRFFSIPEADVRPKPVQQPRPPLMSGMRSEAGLRRTAERFDIWNPASGPLDQLLEVRERLQAMRPADRPPLQVYWNLFVQPPVQVANLRSLTVDELVEMVAAARAAGLEGVMVDANFWSEIERPEDWARVPDLLAPLVSAAAE